MLRGDLEALEVVADQTHGVAVQVVPDDLQLTLNLGPVERPAQRAVDVEPRVITHASSSHNRLLCNRVRYVPYHIIHSNAQATWRRTRRGHLAGRRRRADGVGLRRAHDGSSSQPGEDE